MRTSLFLFLFASACQCGGPGTGGTGGGGGSDAPASIAVTPADAVYTTDGVTPASAQYTAIAHWGDGREEDVTDKATFGVESAAIGFFDKARFQSSLNIGGKTKASASFRGVMGSTTLTLKLEAKLRDPASMNLPPDVDMKFGGTPVASRAPDLVYPNDGVLLPPNVGRLEVHFLPGAGNTLFELHAKSSAADLRVYLRCTNPTNGGCIWIPDVNAYTALAASNRGGDPVTLTLRGTDDAATAVGESAPLQVSFANDAVTGGLYYWSTTARAIMRFDFASATQTTASKFVDAAIAGTPNGCVGCHALSRDGKTMVVEAEGSQDGRIAIVDVATKTNLVPFPAPNKSFFASWNPDSTKFVGVDDRGNDFNLHVMDGRTGMLLESIAGTGTMTRPTDHPDWSADGRTIAYASVTREGPRAVSLQWPTKGAIRFVQQQAAGGWGAPVEVAPTVAGKNRYYPAIAPSSDFLVFNESSCNAGSQADINCDGDADPDAKLFAAKLDASAMLVALAKANGPGKRDSGATSLTNSFPKWNPFNFQRTAQTGTKLQWVTFSSTRNYGLRDPGNLQWLWMAAIDPEQVGKGLDPSYPAFCLPFQDLATSNHIAQWTEVVIPSIN